MMKKQNFQHAVLRIGEGLKQLRLQKGYENLSDFVKDFELPMIQYWRIEAGKTNLTIKSLLKLLAIHGLAIEEFFCWMKQNV
jgi:hypothetical protein